MVKSRQVSFIGREEELAKIKDFIEKQNTRHVLCFLAPGGIGKTRLLSEIHHRYARREMNSLLVGDIIDFDDRALHLSRNVERQIAYQLDQSAFEPYLRELQDLLKMESAGVSPQGLQQQAERVHQTFTENLNQVSSNKRLVLLFDTVEKLENETVWDVLNKLMFASKNTLFVLTGRPDNEWWIPLQTQLGADTKIIELEPLKEESSQQYLNKKQQLLGQNLDSQLESKLLFLAGGRPILLDLAIEWISRNLPLDWMTRHSLEELRTLSQEESAKYKEQFETQLVRQIIEIRHLMDQLTLVMSRIYPLTPAMLVKLLRISENEAQPLFNEAQSYVFVKSLPDGQITLHDEMRRMVNEYVWPEVDPQRKRRRRDSKIAAELFEEEEKQLKERVKERKTGDLGGLFERAALVTALEVVNEQWIEHALYSDTERGFDVWKKIVNERRSENEFIFAKGLLELARPYYEQFNPDQRFEFDMLNARLTNDTGQVRETEKMLHDLLGQNRGRKERESDIYNALSVVESKLGKLWDARDSQLKCLEIVREIQPAFIAPVANQVGYIYRQLGQAKEAEKYYKLALHSSNKSQKILIAGILSNLGYVFGLQRKYSEMEIYCRQAIQIWSELGADKHIGRAEETLGVFSRIIGDYGKAIKLLERAISRYEEPDDHYHLCRTFFELGWTQWYQSEIINQEVSDIHLLDWDEKRLEFARRSLNQSQDLAERYSIEVMRPKIFHINSFVHWYLGGMHKDQSLLNKARTLNAASYEKSQQVGDIRYAISSLLADAEWDYEIEKYDQIEHYAQELQKYKLEGYYYPLFFGRMCRIQGDMAFFKKNYDEAFSKYAEGFVMIHEAGGYSRYSIERELLRLENKMIQNLSPILFEKWAEYLYLQWTNIDDQDASLLKNWGEQQILRAQLMRI